MSSELNFEEYLARIKPGLVPVPAEQPGICRVCRTATKPDYKLCFLCEQLDDLEIRILPVSMALNRDLLHNRLRQYKDGADNQKDRFTLELAVLLESFFRHHKECLGSYQKIAIARSVSRNAPQFIINRMKRFRNMSNVLGRNEDGFELTEDVREQRVLLIDDTFTSGGKAMIPAVKKLKSAGANIVGPLVIGRYVNQDWPSSKKMTGQLKDAEWAESKCCRCDGYEFNPPLRPNTLL